MLEIKNLSVFFHNHKEKIKILSDVSFSLGHNQVLGIVGESGSGKSALAKSIVQLFPKNAASYEGNILFQGKNLLSYSENQLNSIRGKNIGMIFQDPMTALNPTLTIGNQVLEGYLKHFPKTTYLEAKHQAINLFHKIGISFPEKRFDEYPHMLSGGTRQKALIALSLISKPELIIADEPTTALDSTVQMQILSFLKQFQNEHTLSLILVTHDLSLVAGFCDFVLVMYAGQVVEMAAVDDLFYNPIHPYTQKLLSTLPNHHFSKKHILSSIEGTPPEPPFDTQSCRFSPRCPFSQEICKKHPVPLNSLKLNHTYRCFFSNSRLP